GDSMARRVRKFAQGATALWTTLVAAVLLVLLTPLSPPAVAADAAYCVNMCGNRCYANANPSACNASCTANCISQSNAAPPEHHGAIFIAWPPKNAYGWSTDTANSRIAQGTAGNQCMAANNGEQCYELITFTGGCGAIVQALDGSKVLGVFGKARPS